MESTYKLSDMISENCFKLIQTQGGRGRYLAMDINKVGSDHKLVNC